MSNFHDEGSFVHRNIRAKASLSDPYTAKQAVRDVSAFVDLILAAMQPPIRKEISFMIRQEEIGWREDTNRIGILFGAVAEMPFDLPDGTVVHPKQHDSKKTKAADEDDVKT